MRNDNVSTSAAVREQHSHDESYHAYVIISMCRLSLNYYIYRAHEPDVVVYAQSTDHVSQIVKYCASKSISVIPFGTGTGLEGTTDTVFGFNYHFSCFLKAGITAIHVSKQDNFLYGIIGIYQTTRVVYVLI